MKKSLLALPFLVPFCLVSVPAWAEEVVGAPSSQDITVTGLPLPDADDAYSTTVIELYKDERIENSLRNIPGLQQFRRSDARSANPTSQGRL